MMQRLFAAHSPLRQGLGILRYFVVVMAGAYGLNTALLLLLRALVGERWNVIAFFNTFAHLLWLPALFLTPLLLLLRARIAALLCLPGLLAFLFTYGPNFIGSSAAAPAAEADDLTLLSFNLGALVEDFDAAIALIRATDADIVALQELGPQSAAALATAFAEQYSHQALHPHLAVTVGQGLLSKFPVIEDEFWRYEFLPAALGHQRAVLETPRGRLVLYNVHPTHPAMQGSFFDPSWRGREVDDLIARASAETDPVLLAGDFNLTDTTEDYARLAAAFGDAYRAVGWGLGWTFPANSSSLQLTFSRLPAVPVFPLLRLDYIFARGLTPRAARVLADVTGSDHLALWAALR